MAHVKWLTVMVPIHLCLVVSSVAKENSATIINPGPNSQEVQSSTANELAHSLSQHFPGQHSGHGIVGELPHNSTGLKPLGLPH